MTSPGGSSQEIEQVKTLVPEWLALETAYANAKYKEGFPQKTAMSGGLEPGGAAYQDHFKYLSNFGVFYRLEHGDPMVRLKMSHQFGKFMNAGRTLVSAMFQHSGELSRPEADAATLVTFKNHWQAEDTAPYFPEYNADEAIEYMVEAKLRDIRTTADDIASMQKGAMELLVDEAKLFAGLTLRYSVMATPGISSTGTPTAWDRYTVLN
jgi:hypothetical protein